MFKKIRVFVLLLAISSGIVAQIVSPSYASEEKEINNQKVSITEIASNNLLIEGEDGSSELLNYSEVNENGNGRITVNDNVTGESYYFELREDGSIYSSKTNMVVEDLVAIQPRSTTSYITKYYSYKLIVTMVGTYLTLAGVVGGIVALLVRAGIKVAGAKIMALISEITGVMSGITLLNPSSKHGIAIKFKAVKHYRWRAGRKTVYSTDYTPISAWKY